MVSYENVCFYSYAGLKFEIKFEFRIKNHIVTNAYNTVQSKN